MAGWYDLQRLASHSHACSRLSGRPACHVRGRAHNARPFVPLTTKSHAPRHSRCTEGNHEHASFAAQQVLERVDYVEVYQERDPGVIDSTYLWCRLEPLLHYLTDESHRMLVKRALQIAQQAHSGQCRKSGEPFITHPVEVTRILAEMKLDYKCLVAGLLHDTVEDTDCVTFGDIEAWFGADVRKIVEGETKLSKITKVNPDADQKARDLQQLFVAMTEDVRIILVKLADRLHNMRTLYGMSTEKQRKIALETLQVFAPLAKLLGIYCVKEELEDLSLRYVDPDAYHNIRRWQDKLSKQNESAFLNAKGDLEQMLAKDPYLKANSQGCRVRIRQKAAYSIYKRIMQIDSISSMQLLSPATTERRKTINQLLYELKEAHSNFYLQVAIVEQPYLGAASGCTESHQLCYHVLGLVHTIWSPIPGGLKDFIGSPKTNGYQSLHTTVVPLTILSKDCSLIPIEVQIRTTNMDALAELGIAASGWLPQPVKLDGIHVYRAPFTPGVEGAGQELPAPALSKNGHGQPCSNGQNGNGSSLSLCAPPQPAIKMDTTGQGFKSRSSPEIDAVTDPKWLSQMRKWQEELLGNLSAREFVDGVTAEVLGQSVFVYTHTGELRRLPKGSTVVDFAYTIHSELGNEMVGAKVNGHLVAASHVLSNGEVVEIRREQRAPTAASLRRHEQWLKLVRTRSAKLKIHKFLKENSNLHYGDELSSSAADTHRRRLTRKTVTARCQDMLGLLSKVSGIISNCEHNIEAYSGQPATCGDFEMVFTISGPDDRLSNMIQQISQTEGVDSYDVSSSEE